MWSPIGMLKKTVSQLYFACMYHIVYSWTKYQREKNPPNFKPSLQQRLAASIFNVAETEKTLLG